MKVLWLCNIVLPELSDIFGFRKQNVGGWLTGAWEALKEDDSLELAICVPVRNPERMKDGVYNNFRFYSFLTVSYESNSDINSQARRFKEIISEYKPNIIHIWGTEYEHTYSMVEAARLQGYLDRIVVNIQGLLEYCSRVYKTGIDDEIFYEVDNNNSSMNDELLSFRNRAVYEKKVLSIVKYCIGRTDWDKACIKDINPELRYFHCGEILRSSFYNSSKWSYENCEKNTIFISQASYPIKGLHLILEEMAKIKIKYPDLKVYVGGEDLTLSPSQYARYIRGLIKSWELDDCIIFLGDLSESEMVERYLKANVFLSPSVIENSSNSICEAMLLGTPVVASFVGGNSSLIQNGIDGFLYPLNESNMMKYYIEMLFDKAQICERISANGIKKSYTSINNRETITNQIIEIYSKICMDNRVENA